MSEIIKKTSPEVRAAIKRRTAAMLPDRPSQQGFKPADIRAALYEAIISDKGACLMGELDRVVEEINLHLGETVLAQGDDIAALKEMVTTSGSVTIPVAEWSDAIPHDALVRLGDNPISKGCVVLLVPEDNATKEAAGAARMSVFPDNVIDSENSYGDFVMVLRAESGIIPTIPLNFRFVVLKTDTEDKAIAAMVGVDAYGEGGGTAGGVDEEAVRKLISEIVPEWALEEEAPIPDADPPGTAQGLVKAHNESDAAHPDIRTLIQKLEPLVSVLIGGDTDKSVREIAALVIAEALSSAPESLDSLEEMAAWIEAHPKDAAELAARIKALEDEMAGKVSEGDLAEAIEDKLDAAQESGAFTGRRGHSILRVSSSTTSASGTGTNGVAIKYKIDLSKVCTEAGVEAVYVGDTVFRASVYMYPVVKVDESYVYLGAYTSIKGNTGAKGATGDAGYTPVKGTDYWTEEDQAAMLADVLAALPVYSGEVTEV